MFELSSTGGNAQSKPKEIARSKPSTSLKEEVFQFLSRAGPSFPAKISQGVGRESYFIGAVLSELIQSKRIKLSYAKIGGSKLYYLPGQEEKLSILYDHLPNAEKNAYDLLKEKKFLKSFEVDPVGRVALANLQDFSIPVNQEGEQAWRWYLEPAITHVQEQPKIQEPQRTIQTEIKPKIEEIKPIIEEIKPKIEEIKPKIEEIKPIVEEIKPIVEEIKPKQSKEDEFSKKVEEFFLEKQIQVLEKEVIRKNSESNFIIKISSQLGPIELFVCAKNKKKINDQDLMIAHQKGQNQKKQTLFLTTGDSTKKAKEYLEKNLKGQMIFKTF
jgi:hypothetical protein